MASRIVDSELDELKDADNSNLESRLKEETTNNEQPKEEVAEAKEETKEIPQKFQNKSVDEIIDSYSNLEQQYGRQGNELGELRKLADTLIQKNLQETQSQQMQTEESMLSDEDFHADPIQAVRRVVEEALEPIKGAVQQNHADMTVNKLQAKHPDMKEIIGNDDFQKWVMSSTPRQDMWQKASSGDFEYADELFTQYKQLHQISVEKKTEEVQMNKQRELEAATSLSNGGSSEVSESSSKPVYRRAELIRLQIEDPLRYKDLQPEILQAYREGRVR